MDLFYFNLLKIITKVIEDKKGNNPVVLDVRSISTLTDYFVFAEGNVNVHVNAIANAIIETMKEHRVSPLRVEGAHSDWIVLDYGFIIIHLFVASIRELYCLEELWRDGFIITSNLLAS